jgi:ceramide glucosyltransferase
MRFVAFLDLALAVPVVLGCLYTIACVTAMARLKWLARRPPPPRTVWPPVTVLKPICGLEKGLEENVRTTCGQDYPEFQIVLSVQRKDDPALPLLRRIQEEFGAARVDVVVDETQTAPNGKIRNLLGALPFARHDVLVISDSDVRLPPDYLKAIVAPLDEPGVGCACTFYRAISADRWYEALEQLTFNTDFVPSLVFAHVTGAARFLLGASTAIRRRMLEEIGGLAALADYLVEDYEMGRRILATGRRIAMIPRFVESRVDLQGLRQWWTHQVYWDQNTRAANPWGLFGTVFVRSVPFGVLFASARLFDRLGLAVLGMALVFRLGTAAVLLAWGLGDRPSLRRLGLLPLRDVAGLVSWVLAFAWPTVVWRGEKFFLTRDGRMVPRERSA